MKIRPSFISEELELVDAFNRKAEALISDLIRNLEDYIQTVPIEKWVWNGCEDGEVIVDDLRHIEGVSEDDYDLNKIFGDAFSMYQRQSTLITVYSIFESGLSNMCEYAEGLSQTSSSYKHDNNLSKIRNFLNRLQMSGVVPPEIHEVFDFLDNDVRHIRNAWAHDNGKNARGKVREDIEGVAYVYSQLSLSPEFIAKVTKSMNYVAKTITDSIVSKRNS